ncbi:PAS domain-containing sensor histidine kinase [Ruminococcus sp. 5_1_39BFAA]|uniref:sensor histidine kinase n=1 Tax=Ruminococcus sp. 5_1_39BFAA TaxID=457412 RepID=UPI00356399F8
MQANTTAEQLQKEFQCTLSMFSHEIRNPIALISSELQMLASSHPEITAYDCWDDITDNLEYIRELLNDLSDYNNAGKLTLADTDLCGFLGTVLSSVKSTMNYLGIALETDISHSLPTLPIDRVKLRQALLNLLRNAQESISPPHGRILVQAFPVKNGACISIQDNGSGISAEQLPDIFTPFVTFKSTGNGLGLAVTRQIIQAHGGRIEVESALGQGSAFRIFLG